VNLVVLGLDLLAHLTGFVLELVLGPVLRRGRRRGVEPAQELPGQAPQG
jgi:hypothetical protein